MLFYRDSFYFSPLLGTDKIVYIVFNGTLHSAFCLSKLCCSLTLIGDTTLCLEDFCISAFVYLSCVFLTC